MAKSATSPIVYKGQAPSVNVREAASVWEHGYDGSLTAAYIQLLVAEAVKRWRLRNWQTSSSRIQTLVYIHDDRGHPYQSTMTVQFADLTSGVYLHPDGLLYWGRSNEPLKPLEFSDALKYPGIDRVVIALMRF